MLRYLSDNTETVEQLRSFRLRWSSTTWVSLTKRFQSHRYLNWLKSPAGKRTACRDSRSELLNVNGFVVNGCLQLVDVQRGGSSPLND